MARDTRDQIQRGILGDISPEPQAREPLPGSADDAGQNEESMSGGSKHDQTEHAGSRDVTEGTTGGLTTETGGTRNFRTGTGASGTDIGHRPE